MKTKVRNPSFDHFDIFGWYQLEIFWQIPNQKEIIVNQISKKCFLINHPISEYLSNISRDSIYQTVMPNMHTDGYFNNLKKNILQNISTIFRSAINPFFNNPPTIIVNNIILIFNGFWRKQVLELIWNGSEQYVIVHFNV